MRLNFKRFIVLMYITALWPLAIASAQNSQSITQTPTLPAAKSADTEDEHSDNFDFGDFKQMEVNLDQTSADDSGRMSLSGFLQLESAYSYLKPDSDYDFNRKEAETSKIKATLNLCMNVRLSDRWKAKISGNGFYDLYYHFKGRDNFPSETLEAYEYEYEFRDTYVEGLLWDNTWIKFGRQIIAWGESDVFQISDMGNPRDNRELGQMDVEDLRIPVTATQLTYLLNTWELNAVAVHEIRPNKIATKGSEFDRYILFRLPGVEIGDEKTPDNRLDNTEWLFRIFKRFNRGDVSLIFANVYDDNAFLDFDSARFKFTPRHRRIKVYGGAGNLVIGSWLIKLELVHKTGVAMLNDNSFAQLQGLNLDQRNWSDHRLTQAMVGLDYTGISDLTVSLESVWTSIGDYEENLTQDENSFDFALTIDYDMFHATLHPQFFWRRFNDDNGNVYRFSVSYDIRDALQLTAGIALFDAGKDGFIHPYRKNDYIYAVIRYSLW